MLNKLADARTSRGSVILLAGEPGIGKTRLTEEFCEHASSGATVIRGNCYEGDVSAPFGPWTEALRSLIEQTPDAGLRETHGPGAPDIAVMMPEIKRRMPDLEEAPKLDPESERARLFESIGAFLRNAADKRPQVIFLDDLHWCDRPSLALLEQVARGITDKRIVIVGTYRDVEVDRVHPLAQTLAALRRMEHHERIAIRGFTQESVYDLLHAIEPSEQAEASKRALAAVLHTEAEGNPFFIREVLNNLIETGKFAQQDGVWTGTVNSIEELGIPEGIKEAIGRRLSRVSETCNHMLGRASAMTSGFTWDEIKAISGEPEDTLLDALDEALGSQLLAERSRNAYVFTHALIRQTLYEELSTPRRVLLHRRIGEALESLYASSIETHLPELAHHFFEAATGGDVEKSIDYASWAGRCAAELYAWEEAVAHCKRALEAIELLPVSDDRRRVQLLLALGDALSGAGDGEHARDVFARAADVARSMGDAEAFATAALGLAARPPVSDPRMGVLLVEALSLLAPDDSVLRTMVTARLAQTFGGTALAQDALAMARRVGDEAVLLYTLGRIFWDGEAIDEVIRLAQETGNKMAESEARMNRVIVSLIAGDRNVADATVDLYERLIEELRTSGLVSQMRAMQARLDGRLEAAEALAHKGRVDFSRSEPRNAVNFFAMQMLDLRRAQGRAGVLESGWRRAADQFPGVPSFRVCLGLVYAEADRRDDARAIFDELTTDDFAVLSDHIMRPMMLAYLTDVCCYLGDQERAAALYKTLLPLADQCIAFSLGCVCTGSASNPLGKLATTLGRFNDAERHFEDAIAMNRKLRAPTWVAEAQLGYARMLRKRDGAGDGERARELLDEALAAAREIGMAKVASDCEALLA